MDQNFESGRISSRGSIERSKRFCQTDRRSDKTTFLNFGTP